MLNCLRLQHKQSTNVFPSIRSKSLGYFHGNRCHSNARFTQNVQNSNITSASVRCIHSANLPMFSTATAPERTKYESNILPKNARVVICGGGVMGGMANTLTFEYSPFFEKKQYSNFFICSFRLAAVAYHLASQGLGDEVVLLEQDRFVFSCFVFFCVFYRFYRFFLFLIQSFRIGGGMTWHSSGLVGAFKPTYSQVLLAQQTIKLYEDLTSKGFTTGWKQCGSLNLARTRDRMTQFRRMKALSAYVFALIHLLHLFYQIDSFQTDYGESSVKF